MSEERAQARQLGGVFAECEARDEDGDAALGRIKDQGCGGGGFVSGAQNIRSPDIAGTDGAQIAQADSTGDDDAEGDGAEEVGEYGDEGQHRRIGGELGHGQSALKICMPAT